MYSIPLLLQASNQWKENSLYILSQIQTHLLDSPLKPLLKCKTHCCVSPLQKCPSSLGEIKIRASNFYCPAASLHSQSDPVLLMGESWEWRLLGQRGCICVERESELHSEWGIMCDWDTGWHMRNSSSGSNTGFLWHLGQSTSSLPQFVICRKKMTFFPSSLGICILIHRCGFISVLYK